MEGMQPTFKQVPPKVPLDTIQTVWWRRGMYIEEGGDGRVRKMIGKRKRFFILKRKIEREVIDIIEH